MRFPSHSKRVAHTLPRVPPALPSLRFPWTSLLIQKRPWRSPGSKVTTAPTPLSPNFCGIQFWDPNGLCQYQWKSVEDNRMRLLGDIIDDVYREKRQVPFAGRLSQFYCERYKQCYTFKSLFFLRHMGHFWTAVYIYATSINSTSKIKVLPANG